MSLPLIAFLSARLDEDERYARMALEDDLHGKSAWVVDGKLATLPNAMSVGLTLHFVRHDPARVLREVAAARELIATYEQAARGDRPHDRTVASVLFLQIASRAAAYSDHPGYRQEWKP